MYSKERRHEYYSSILEMVESQYGEGITESRKYIHSEWRYRLRKFIYISEELKKNGYSFVISNEEIEYIYKMSACGMNYIGKTKDPFKRFVEHMTSTDCSSSLVIDSAIDNNIVPKLEVIDICEAKATAVEAYWIGSLNCINKQTYKKKRYELEKSPNSYKCVVARKRLGIEPFEFDVLKNIDGYDEVCIC